MLKVSEKLSQLGVLDIFPMHPIGLQREGDGIPDNVRDYQVISIDVDSDFTVDTALLPPITEEKIIEAVYRIKSMYLTRSVRYYCTEMALPPDLRTLPSGTISMSQVNDELQRPSTQTISLNDADVRYIADRPSGTISMSDLRGKSRDFWVESGAYRWENAEVSWWIPSNIKYKNATIRYSNGAWIHSNSTNIYALHVRNVLADHVILEFMSGSRCVGRGGNGGAGGATGGGGGGGGGGAAIYRGMTLTVQAHGGSVIAGGGGGGGGGGGASVTDNKGGSMWCGGGGGGGGYGGGAGGPAGSSSGGAQIVSYAGGGGAGNDTGNGGGGGGGSSVWAQGKGGQTGSTGGAGGAGGWAGANGGGGGTASGSGASHYGGGPGGAGAGTGYSMRSIALAGFTLDEELTSKYMKRDPDVEFVYKNESGDTVTLFRSGACGMPGELVVHGVDDGNFKLVMM